MTYILWLAISQHNFEQQMLQNNPWPLTATNHPSYFEKTETSIDEGQRKNPIQQHHAFGRLPYNIFSFCCSGETTVEQENHYDPSRYLSYSDLAVDNPSNPLVMSMLIKKSKTDQGRKGAKVYFGKTGDSLCPMEPYLSIRRSNSGLLFRWESGVPLSKSST